MYSLNFEYNLFLSINEKKTNKTLKSPEKLLFILNKTKYELE